MHSKTNSGFSVTFIFRIVVMTVLANQSMEQPHGILKASRKEFKLRKVFMQSKQLDIAIFSETHLIQTTFFTNEV